MKKTTNEEGYWFRSKRYGWGWGMPLTRQGWLVFGLFVAIWLAALLWMLPADLNDEPTLRDSIIFSAILVADVAMLVYFSVKHGEPPKWRWGKKTHAAKSKSD